MEWVGTHMKYNGLNLYMIKRFGAVNVVIHEAKCNPVCMVARQGLNKIITFAS